MFFKSKYVRENYLARVYMSAMDDYKIQSEYYGTIGTKTDLIDIDGTPLYVGDIVVGKNNYKNFVCCDRNDDSFFCMDLKSGNNIVEWKIKKFQDYRILKIGDKINDMYMIEGREIQKYSKGEVLKSIDNIKDLNLHDTRKLLKKMIDNIEDWVCTLFYKKI